MALHACVEIKVINLACNIRLSIESPAKHGSKIVGIQSLALSLAILDSVRGVTEMQSKKKVTLN